MTSRQPHHRRRVPAYAAVVVLFLALVGSLGLTTSSASAAPYCGIVWGSLAKSGGSSGAQTVAGVRTGRHDCYDRLVVDLNGGPWRLMPSDGPNPAVLTRPGRSWPFRVEFTRVVGRQ